MKSVVELIALKRNGGQLEAEDIRHLIAAYTRGDVPDYQMSALLMAIYYRGMVPEELGPWTQAMLHSGEVIDLSALPMPKVDKHSTGGVGDKISLPLAPVVAACGAGVPMISGRGLGHTGGTLDKLESIPGFTTQLSEEQFIKQVADLGVALIGQTGQICPADKKLYALRDVTATVESIPLISSSIMSKKLAEGIDALVLDVKIGSGAFMKTLEDGRVLAETMVGIGANMGKKVVALLTDMSQPLGTMIGNAMEVKESIEILQGGGPADVRALTIALAEEMLTLSGLDPAGAARSLDDGSALKVFERIIEAQGGDPNVCNDPNGLASEPHRVPYAARQAGYVSAMETTRIGMASVALGAGRARVDDVIDPSVGLEMAVRIGDQVEVGQPLLWIHHADKGVDAATRNLDLAFTITDETPAALPLLLERVD